MSIQPGGDGQPTEQVLVSVGDISCTQHWVVTPSGSFPLRATVWTITNNTTTSQVIPTWAIVMAILFALACLLGLLFLLVKETRTLGYVQVSVSGDQLFHATQIPVSSVGQIVDVDQRVNYIRGLVVAAG